MLHEFVYQAGGGRAGRAEINRIKFALASNILYTVHCLQDHMDFKIKD